jgi:UPF0176 protein
MDYQVIAYYIFTTIQDPHLEIKKHKEFFSSRDMKGRIYISEEGINAQLSGFKPHAQEYIDWMRQDERFANIDFKIHEYHDNAFAKMTVKYRKQLVALDEKVDMNMTGVHLSPKEWDDMLEKKDENTVILDVRNQYEWEVGHFEGADKTNLETFREFKGYAKELKEVKDPSKTKVMMYCTGGIRCELYSCLLKDYGFNEVYQLNGGVIRYGLERGAGHWRGKLFVFDDRMVVPISEDNQETLTACQCCDKKVDHYYNCANMDCNGLFIACKECFEKEKGCCCNTCKDGRVRPIALTDGGKPFRKLDKAKKTLLASGV